MIGRSGKGRLFLGCIEENRRSDGKDAEKHEIGRAWFFRDSEIKVGESTSYKEGSMLLLQLLL